jgi:hypothetical protein
MPDLAQEVQDALGQRRVERLGQHLGADPARTGRAVEVAVPVLLEALRRNARSRRGARALHEAVKRDHDPSFLDKLDAQVDEPRADGDAILGHVLGARRGGVEQGISQLAGLDAKTIGKLLAVLAPILMSVLARRQQQRRMDPGDLSDTIDRDRGGGGIPGLEDIVRDALGGGRGGGGGAAGARGCLSMLGRR